MTPSLPRLSSMGVGDVLDGTFRVYRRHFALLAGIAAILGAPRALLTMAALARLREPFTQTTPSDPGGLPVVQLQPDAILAGLQLLALSAIVGFVCGVILTGTLAYAVSSTYLGRSLTIRQAFSGVGILPYVNLILGAILGVILLIVGILSGLALYAFVLFQLVTSHPEAIFVLFLVVPLLPIGLTYLFLSLIFIPQVIVLERKGVLSGIWRSATLIRGHRARVWRTYAALTVLTTMLSYIFGGGISQLLGMASPGSIGIAAGLGAVVSILLQPVQLGAMTLLYYDVRIRKEGFDIEHLALAMESSRAVHDNLS